MINFHNSYLTYYAGFSFLLMGMTVSIMYFNNEHKSMKEYSIWNYLFNVNHVRSPVET